MIWHDMMMLSLTFKSSKNFIFYIFTMATESLKDCWPCIENINTRNFMWAEVEKLWLQIFDTLKGFWSDVTLDDIFNHSDRVLDDLIWFKADSTLISQMKMFINRMEELKQLNQETWEIIMNFRNKEM